MFLSFERNRCYYTCAVRAVAPHGMSEFLKRRFNSDIVIAHTHFEKRKNHLWPKQRVSRRFGPFTFPQPKPTLSLVYKINRM